MMRRRLTPAQASIVRKARRLRKKLTDKALAVRFNVAERTIYDYANGKHK